jgi:hypothetical protein
MAQIGRVTGFHKKTHVSEKDLLDDLGKESSGASHNEETGKKL